MRRHDRLTRPTRFAIITTMMLVLAACAGAPVEQPPYSFSKPPGWESAPAAQAPATPAPRPAAQPNEIVVARGDTLSALAQKHGVAPGTLAKLNKLSPPYRLYSGQTLRLPRPAARPRPETHIVKRGETVYGIAKSYGTDMAALVRLNEIAPPYVIEVGQKLRLPKPANVAPPAVEGPTAVAKAPLPSYTPPQDIGATPVTSLPSRSSSGFLWPVRGRVLVGFGPRGKGHHNDGINIAARRGTPVHATENGVVVYTGNQLSGFGNLVLLRHDDGWMSAYAHNELVVVKTGERVRRGDVIAHVGSSGGVAEPQLHFELRRNQRAVDPIDHLPTVRVERETRVASR